MLIVPKAYSKQYDAIKAKNDFKQISILIWLDSAPQDWLDRITNTGYKAFVSPLHDKDVLEDGSAKKAHYHVLFLFKGRKTYDQCQQLADYISGQDDYSWLYVVDREVHARYLCHLDSPKKHRYPLVDIIQVNGANILKFVNDEDNDQQTDDVLNDILDWISQERCRFFNVLVDYARNNNKALWISRLRKDLTPFVKAYMQGLTLQDYDIEKTLLKNRSHS